MTTEDGERDGDIPKEGDVLAGKYRIDRVLGRGGMGVVVAAHHTTLRQNVAVKFLLASTAKRGDATERFLREARAAVSIQSEHVARVTDVGTLESGAPYMVMEFLTGSDLGQVLEERGPLPVEEAVDYVLQACEAIAEAHALGLIHRDLKPANLFVTTRADGSPLIKVLDFGLSKATKPDTLDASLTATNVVMGSPYYMSPEQIRSFKSTDARSDVWSIGVILYQLLTGAYPFEGESLGALFMAIGSDAVPGIRERRPEIPEGLEAAIAKCLEKSPAARTQTIAELARSLAPFGAEDSHISVERIMRVLSDSRPYTRPSLYDRPSQAAPLPLSRVTSRPSSTTASSTTAGATSRAAADARPSEPAQPPAAKSGSIAAVSQLPTVKSGSMAALSVSEPGAPAPTAVPAPPKRRGPLVALAAVAIAGVLGLVAVRELRGGKGHTAAMPAAAPESGTAAPAATALSTPSSAPSPAPSSTGAGAVLPVAAPEEPAAPAVGGVVPAPGTRAGFKKGAPGSPSASASAAAVATAAPLVPPTASALAPPAAATAAGAAAPEASPLESPYGVDAPEPPPAATAAPAAPGAASAASAARPAKPVKKGKLPARRVP